MLLQDAYSLNRSIPCPEQDPRAADVLGGCAGMGDIVSSLCEPLGDLGAEHRQVLRLAARDEALVDDDFLIDPFATGIADIGFQRGPRGGLAVAYKVCLDERPGTMADHTAGLACREDLLHELDRPLVG